MTYSQYWIMSFLSLPLCFQDFVTPKGEIFVFNHCQIEILGDIILFSYSLEIAFSLNE